MRPSLRHSDPQRREIERSLHGAASQSEVLQVGSRDDRRPAVEDARLDRQVVRVQTETERSVGEPANPRQRKKQKERPQTTGAEQNESDRRHGCDEKARLNQPA